MNETQIPVADYTDHNEVIQSMQAATISEKDEEERSLSTEDGFVSATEEWDEDL